MTELTAQLARQLWDYDATTGHLYWKISRGKSKVGKVAGTVDSSGYLVVRVFGQGYKAHRIAWLIVYGKWPEKDLDHKDGNKLNNAILNLREATPAENQQNKHRAHMDSNTGLLGVWYYPSLKKFKSGIAINGKITHLGYFDTAEAAHAAYLKAKSEAHPFSTLAA